MEHLKMSAIYVDGELQRFCQQCGRFHDLDKFDGDKRNCRERLSQHNRRRRKSKRETGGSDGSWDDFGQDQPAGKAQKGRRSKRLVQSDQTPLWGDAGYDGTHGMASEDQSMLGSVGMEMMQGIPVGASGSAALHPFGDSMALPPDVQAAAQERESLVNMMMHQVMPNPQTDLTSETKPASNAEFSPIAAGITSGEESLPNLSTLLQHPESMVGNPGGELGSNVPLMGVQGGVGMFQSVCVSAPGGSVPTVPMLVFPSASAPHQLNAVAIIPSATSSCSTIVPLPWQGGQQPMSQLNPQVPVGQPLSLPMQLQHPIESSVSAAAADPGTEIPPLVSLALSASGIAQGSGSHVYHPSISPNQLAHFQMLMARQISMCQSSEVPQAPMETKPEDEIKKEKDEPEPPK